MKKTTSTVAVAAAAAGVGTRPPVGLFVKYKAMHVIIIASKGDTLNLAIVIGMTELAMEAEAGIQALGTTDKTHADHNLAAIKGQPTVETDCTIS